MRHIGDRDLLLIILMN